MSLSPEQGDPWATIRRLVERVATLERADRLIASSVGAGGLTVKDGGSVTVEGGDIVIKDAAGDVQATLGTDGLTLNGLLEVLAGMLQWEDDSGDVRLKVGVQGTNVWPAEESVRLVYQDGAGNQRLVIGELLATADGALLGHGLLVQEAGGDDLLVAREGKARLSSGDGFAYFSADDVDEIDLYDAAGNIRATLGPVTWGGSPDGYGVFLEKADGTPAFFASSGGHMYVYIDGGARSGEVTAGAADSGGAGFRLLRIPN